jgi:hypothetical protein
MSTHPATLGGRLPLLDRESLAPAQKKLFDQMMDNVVPRADSAGFVARTDAGQLIGPFNPALLNPAIGSAFLELQFTEETHTSLSQRTRQVVILTVGAVWQAPCELYAIPRWAAARDSPMTRCAHWLPGGCPRTSPNTRSWPTASPGPCRSSIVSTTRCTGRPKHCSVLKGSSTSSCSSAFITPCAQSSTRSRYRRRPNYFDLKKSERVEAPGRR